MRDLNNDLKRLQAARDDGSHGTRTARSYALAQMADTLHDLGFKGLRATGLKRKHAVALVKEWQRQGRSAGTMKNRAAQLRWWAERIGKPGVVPSNRALGIANREYVTNEDKSVVLDPEKLALVKDEHVVLALRMEAEFGLRREEAIKFTPSRVHTLTPQSRFLPLRPDELGPARAGCSICSSLSTTRPNGRRACRRSARCELSDRWIWVSLEANPVEVGSHASGCGGRRRTIPSRNLRSWPDRLVRETACAR